MELQKTLHNKSYKKDIQKGQKIVAAVYLITRHLSDTDALKDTLRSTAVSFIVASSDAQFSLAITLETLLGGAVLAGLISEKNSSIVVYEINRFVERTREGDQGDVSLDALFPTDVSLGAGDVSSLRHRDHSVFHKGHDKGHNTAPMSLKPHTQAVLKDSHKSLDRSITKASRQDKILSFINDRKSAVIKDIVALFPDVSEKTIQRELNTLIDTGRITKRGSKRWSIYMAVNSLL